MTQEKSECVRTAYNSTFSIYTKVYKIIKIIVSNKNIL